MAAMKQLPLVLLREALTVAPPRDFSGAMGEKSRPSSWQSPLIGRRKIREKSICGAILSSVDVKSPATVAGLEGVAYYSCQAPMKF